MTAPTSPTITAALDLAERGFPVLQVRPRGKQPATKHGVLDATTDPTAIRAFSSNANIGIACGAAVRVLDIDDPDHADAKRLMAELDAIGTPYVTTTRGRHYYLAGAAEPTVALPFGELRGQGSYVVAPPSIHPSGGAYAWTVGLSGELPPVPDVPVLRSTGKLGAGEAPAPKERLTHGRADHLIDFGRRLVRSGVLDVDAIEQHMRTEFELRCDPVGYSTEHWHDEIERFAKDATKSDIATREREAITEAEEDAWYARQAGTGNTATPDDEPKPPTGLLAQRVLLGQKVRDGVPPPEFLPSPSLAPGLFYLAHLFIVSGHKKTGKTLLMAAVALDAMASRLDVVYVDLENGEDIISERLALMGADPDVLDERFYYLPFPKGLTLATFRDQLEQVASELPGAFVIFDSLRGLFTRLSATAKQPLNINDPTDIEKVLGPVNDVVKTSKLTAGVIDHAKKGGSKDDEYSTANSVGKEQVADAVYFVTKAEAYSEDQQGVISLHVTSDRRGKLPTHSVYWRVGGQGAGNRLRFTPTVAHEVGPAGVIHAEVLRYLTENAGQQFTKAELEKAIDGTAKTIRDALERLADEDGVAVHRVSGKRQGSVLFTYDADRQEPPL